MDQLGKPIPVPPIAPQTEQEKFEYEEALKRRELRLLLAGKLSSEQAQYFTLKTKS